MSAIYDVLCVMKEILCTAVFHSSDGFISVIVHEFIKTLLFSSELVAVALFM